MFRKKIKIQFLFVLAILIVLGILSTVPVSNYSQDMPSADAPSEFHVYPNVQAVRPNSAWILWRWNGDSTATISLSTSPDLVPDQLLYNTGLMSQEGRFKVTGLEPGEKYYYRVIADGSSPILTHDIRSFKTPDGDGSTTSRKIVAYADTRGPYFPTPIGSSQYVVSYTIGNIHPDLVLHLGDFAYTARRCNTLVDEFFIIQDPIFSQSAWLPAYGNHEFMNTQPDCSYIPMPPDNPYPDFEYTYINQYLWSKNEPHDKYYHHQYQNIKFFALFIPFHTTGAYAYFNTNTEQFSWAENELKAAYTQLQNGEIDFIIPVFHSPLVYIYKEENGKHYIKKSFGLSPWLYLFKNYGVQVVFQACKHHYQHFTYEGIHWIVNGGGGSPLDGVSDPIFSNTPIYDEALPYDSPVGEAYRKAAEFGFDVIETGLTSGIPSLTLHQVRLDKDTFLVNDNTPRYLIERQPDLPDKNPDLEITDLGIEGYDEGSSLPQPGTNIYIWGTILNAGNVVTPPTKPVTCTVFVDNNLIGSFTVEDYELNEWIPLYPNHSHTGTCETPWEVAAGEHTIKVVADYYNQIQELNENNNELTKVFTFGSPSENEISVTIPNGNENWEVGSSHSITWTSTGTVENVNIDYSVNNGASWTNIVTSTANDGSYNWIVPNNPSSQCLVRVSEIDGDPVDTSDAVFTIFSPQILSITVTSPNGGENWQADSSHSITWTSTGTVGDVKIDYSINNGTSWTNIVSATANDGSYNWTVPNNPSTNCRVRVSETDGDPVDTSNGVFTISPAQATMPFGTFETPANNATVCSSIPVTGWALDDLGVKSVKIEVKRPGGTSLTYIGEAVFVEGARPDVEAAYPGYPNNSRAGWGYMMLTNCLPALGQTQGDGAYELHAVATDIEDNQVTLGIKTITVDNDPATNPDAAKPFGAIDTPAQGGTASGSSYRVLGWVLTPPDNEIPKDGSTIHLYIDGVDYGNVQNFDNTIVLGAGYNIYRADIASLFPGYNNSQGALAYFDIDTTAFSDGIHTICWKATDNAGNADGIGSRYFTIDNSQVRKPASLTGPMPGTTLSGSAQTFGWSEGSGVSAYRLDVGTSPGGSDIHDGSATTLHWQEVSNLPTNGGTVHVRLSSQIDGVWIDNDYTYVAAWEPVVYQPEISLDKTTITRSLLEGWSLSSDTFQVRNSGTGTLEYTVVDNRSWLSVSPTGGTSTGEWDTISINYSTGSMEVGTYTAVITVSAPNISAKILSITVNVNDPDSLFTFADIGEMTGGDPRTRIWGSRGITNSDIPGGPVAVGRGSDGGEGNGFTAFRWQNGTFVGLPRTGVTPYTSNSWGYGISADGSVVYGGDLDNAAANQAVVWTNTGSGWASANKIVLSGSSGWGALSADGKVIVDYSDNVAYKFTTSDNWATSGGVSRAALTGMTTARGCSADGSIIVGTDASGPAIFNGPGGPATTVSLPGPGTCLAVSDDGTVVAGTSPTNIYGKDEPCQWVYSDGIWEKTILPLLPGMVPEYRKPTGYVLAVSADGRRIAGHFREYGDYYIPLVWENGGVQRLEDMLNAAGIFLDSGWYLADLGAMSPDGKTFGGSMSDQPIGSADNNRHAWIATIEGAAGSDIFDSGFETDTGWTFNVLGSFPCTSVYRSTWGIANEHSGSYALALSNQAYARADTDFIAAGPGSHTISAWMRGEMDGSSFGGWILQAFFYDSNKQALSTAWLDASKCTGLDTCLSTTWTEMSGVVDAPAGTAYIKIRLRIYMVGGWIAFDDVALDGNPLTVATHGVDGGFETDTGWTFGTHSSFPGSSVFRSNWGTANEHSGSYALALSNQAYAKADTDFIAAGPGSHTISAWVRGEMNASSFGGWVIRVFFYDSDQQALSTAWLNASKCLGLDTCLSTTWAEMSGTVDAPAGTAFIKIKLLFYMAGGYVVFDDVNLDGELLSVAVHGVDGGFETETGWTFGTHSSFPGSSVFRATWGTAVSHSGSYALALSNQAYANAVTDYIAAVPGSYTVTAWLRGEMDESSFNGWLIRAYFYDSNKQALSPASQNVQTCSGSADCLTTTWTEKRGTVEAPAGTAYIKLRLYFYLAGGWIAYDDVEIEKAN